MRTVRSTLAPLLVGAVVLITACVATSEPQLEASPSVGVAVVGASPTQSPTEPDPNIDTRPDIYLVDPKSGAASLLLSAPGFQTNPEVSSQGKRVVYESGAPGKPSQIFVRQPDGTKQRLTQMKGGASDPTWSPDGTQIAFAGIRRRDGDLWPDADIFVMNADGTHIRRFAGTPKDDGHPDWSPDGSRIVFHGRRSNGRNVWASLPLSQIWVASVHDRTQIRLEHNASSYGEIDPSWSPDGRWIAYSSVDAMINGRLLSSALWLMRPNGTLERRVVRSAGSFHVIENPSWSPDGRSIVFEENDAPGGIHWDGAVGGVRIINVRSERRRWAVGHAASDQPSWGPEGIFLGLSPDDAAAMPEAPVQDGWDPAWEPSRSERPDATIVMTGSGCRQADPAHVLDPGVLAFRFVNDSHLESVFTVVRSARGQRLRDLWGKGAHIGGDWSDFLNPSSARIWSSPGRITSGWWAVVCWKDRIVGGNGIGLKKAGIVGPIEVV